MYGLYKYFYTSGPFSKLGIILYKNYLYFNNLHGFLLFSDILNQVVNKKYYEKDNAIKKKLHPHLDNKNKYSGIQSFNATYKQCHQDRLGKSILHLIVSLYKKQHTNIS